MRSRGVIGWLVGLLAAGVTVGVGELVAAFVRPEASPLIAVGNRIITLTPESAKRPAIQTAGTNDKTLLIGGILLLIAVFGAMLGTLALNRLRNGLVGVGVIGAFGVYCALTANASRVGDIVPTVVGTVAGMVTLTALVRIATGTDRDAADAPAARGTAGVLPDRRRFLTGSAAAAALAAVAGFGGRAAQHSRFDATAARAKVVLPPARSASTLPVGVDLRKSGVPWGTPSRDFYRIDTALTVPQLDPQSWSLRIYGMVDHPITLSYQQLLARPLVERWITLCCVSNEVGGELVGNARFRGALLADLLREAGISRNCDQLLMRSSDGMTIGAPTKVVMDGRDAMLAVGMNGAPLPIEHGFPARVVVPGLYGYVSACKWVVDIEATTYDAATPYWVGEGWAAKPTIRLASRIDRPSSQETVSVGETVAVAGVAWDQHVGVSKVEVQVDDGPWEAARLAKVPSTDTWRQWVFPWTPEKSGAHRLRVRATDGAGHLQDPTARDPFPSGATGLHTVSVHAVV